MRITVLGGTGHLGALTVRALQAANVEVQVASRRGPLVVDATKPETFSALRGSDVVIDLIDATTTAPDQLAAFCVREGLCLIEATSDAAAVERLGKMSLEGPGLLVLGGGIFTGVSNLLARRVSDEVKPCRRVELGISSSPFSGAGKGTIALMTSALAQPAVRYENGRRVEVAELERGPALPFARGARASLRFSFAEQSMLPASTGAPNVDVYFAPRPSWLVTSFLLLPGALLRSGLFAWLLGVYFTVLRRVLLRGVATAVELIATAEGATTKQRTVWCRDGMAAGGYALAAMALTLGERRPAASGRTYIDDVVTLEEVVARANALAGSTVIELR